MNKKAVVGITVTIILAIIGSAWSLSLDFSTTTIGQIGDNIINNYLADQGINLDEFKKLCDSGEVHDELKQYCTLLT